MSEIVITKENFNNEVMKSKKPVLIDFWATWCGPCRMIAPTIDEIANEYDGKIIVGKCNVDEQPELANSFKIASIPTVILIKDGKIAGQLIGYRPKNDFVKLLDSSI